MSAPATDSSPWAGRIHALGARVTPARVAVLQLLEHAERALSHREIEEALAAGFDRVTLYRVLDWLVDSGLGHRVTDAERVFRFSLAQAETRAHGLHAHFRCEDCGKVFCLDEVPAPAPPLPAGFSSHTVEYTITGHCARCEPDEKPR
ncbi:MAG: transcriptional repressor [Candidatus Dactylopiibacterium sp.]|nr:transcriptional repressor [Candidatus Dactylopiibacterium sp.]